MLLDDRAEFQNIDYDTIFKEMKTTPGSRSNIHNLHNIKKK